VFFIYFNSVSFVGFFKGDNFYHRFPFFLFFYSANKLGTTQFVLVSAESRQLEGLAKAPFSSSYPRIFPLVDRELGLEHLQLR
jgi:hypothetical protein